MLYSCLPAGRAGAAPKRRRTRAAPSVFTVDVHCHVHVPAADEVVGDALRSDSTAMDPTFSNQATRDLNRRQMQAIAEQLTSVDRRLADMDAAGIDVQALSPAPPQYYYGVEPELGRAAARVINDRIAEIVAAHPDRFVALGTVPMQVPELAVVELERIVRKLDFRGVELATNVGGEELSAERFRKVFAKAEELGVLVFLHPNGFSDGRRLADHYFINVIGNPLDSTVAVSHLIFDGVLEAHPKLKICVAHGGGYLPAYAGRMDHAHAAREDCRRVIKRKPTSYLKKLYFDSVVFTHAQLEYLVAQYGSDHVLLGTDYPFDMGVADPVGFIESAARLKRVDKAAIRGGNAARLLKIRLRRTAPARSRR